MTQSARWLRPAPFLASLLTACLPLLIAQAQTPTPEQLQMLQSLPADQQQAILQQVAGGNRGGSTAPAPAESRRTAQQIDETAQRARAQSAANDQTDAPK
jgi:hypothetical protein